MTSRVFKKGLLNSLVTIIGICLISCGLTDGVESHASFVEDEDVALQIFSGDGQYGIINQELDLPIQVRAIGDNGEVMSGERIQFSIVSGDAQVTPYSSTNSLGIAQANITIGSNPEHIQVKAFWPTGQRQVIFNLFGSLALLKVQQAPSYNSTENCVGENQSYETPVIIELIGEENTPVSDTDILINIVNGSLDQTAFEQSQTYTTANNGKIAFDITSGVVSQDSYASEVSVSVIVPSMLNVPPLVLDLEVTKDKYIQAISPEIQYSDPTPGVIKWLFDFQVKVLGQCHQILSGENVVFERRWNVPQSLPCFYESGGVYGQSWTSVGTEYSDSNGVATLNRELEVRFPFANYFFPQFNQLQASVVNANSIIFEATSGICEN